MANNTKSTLAHFTNQDEEAGATGNVYISGEQVIKTHLTGAGTMELPLKYTVEYYK